jgi:hypothetical protein
MALIKMDIIDTLLGSSMVVLSSVVLILWTRVAVKVSQIESIDSENKPIKIQETRIQNLEKQIK